ncbi:MAG: PilZ domain-containing protein [Candidatus Omnitrophota bacterium]
MEASKKTKIHEWDDVNRRRYLRVEFPFTIHIHTFEGPTYSAYTENASAGGVKVTLEEELKMGAITDLEIFTRKEVLRCKGQIVWIKKRESKYLEGTFFFDTGIEFHDISEKDRIMIKDLIAEALDGKEETC